MLSSLFIISILKDRYLYYQEKMASPKEEVWVPYHGEDDGTQSAPGQVRSASFFAVWK